MPAGPQVAHRYTIEDYLKLEEETGEKWEFFDGEVFRWDAMAGSTIPHARISTNASVGFDKAFQERGRRCASLTSDAKLSVVRMRRYRYPDLMVVCGEPAYDSKLAHALLNPSLVVEVVSKSSRYMDYVTKRRQYAKVEAIRDYVIVEQDFPLVTVHSRDDSKAPWKTTQHGDLEASVHFPSVDVEVLLGEFYRDIVFTEDGPKFQPGAGIPPPLPDDFGEGGEVPEG